MTVTVSGEIKAPRERVWQHIIDIDRWAETISGIISVDILERPADGIIGLKWREERMMFGKNAFETMWITAAEPGHWYETAAENHGAIYNTRVSVDESNGNSILTMQFSVRPVTFAARLMSLMSFMFNGTIRKMLDKDLQDIRHALES